MRNYGILLLFIEFYAMKRSEAGHKLNFKGSDLRKLL